MLMTSARDAVEGPETVLDGSDESVRRCIVTGDRSAKHGLLRLAIGPDDQVAPDVDERLPGRGLWISARRGVLERLDQKALSRAARRSLSPPAGLADLAERQIAARCVSLIGLARRGGGAVAGYQKVVDLLRRGPSAVALVLEAADGAADGRGKIEAAAKGLDVRDVLSSVEIGMAFGRAAMVHAAIAPGGVARKLTRELARLEGLRRSE